MGNQGEVRTGEKGGLERAFCVDHLGPHTDPQRVLGGQASTHTSAGPQGPHSQHPLLDRVAGLLAEESPVLLPFLGLATAPCLFSPK